MIVEDLLFDFKVKWEVENELQLWKKLTKWKKRKEQEEQLLRTLNVDETIISQLHQYDWETFKAERRIRRKQNVTLDSLFYNVPYYDQKEIVTVDDLLDEIENEALFHYLSQTDQTTLTIILLKILGYSAKEISQRCFHLSTYTSFKK